MCQGYATCTRTGKDAEWALGMVWLLQKRQKSLDPSWSWTLTPQSSGPYLSLYTDWAFPASLVTAIKNLRAVSRVVRTAANTVHPIYSVGYAAASRIITPATTCCADVSKMFHLMPHASFPLLEWFTAFEVSYQFFLLIQQFTLHLINTTTIKPASIPTTK
jgi:hypothetical protein